MKTSSSSFYRPTHRDLAIHLPRLTRRSTRAPRHKGQIGTILARKTLDLTVRTTRLLLIAWRSRQSAFLSHNRAAEHVHFLRLLRHVKQPVLTLCLPAGVGLRGMVVGRPAGPQIDEKRPKERAEPPPPRKVLLGGGGRKV